MFTRSVSFTFSISSFHIWVLLCFNFHIFYFQYLFEIDEKDDEVLIALTQKSGRDEGQKDTIGFTVMQVSVGRSIDEACCVRV